MSQNCFRVLSERYMTSEIDFVRWNPKYDLLAIATVRGDVILQRLFWKKAWQISAEHAFSGSASHAGAYYIAELCWSPNGKHLAVIYSTGKIIFVEVENGRITHEISDGLKLQANSKSLCPGLISNWVEMRKDENGADLTASASAIAFDDGDDLLLPLPPSENSGRVGGGLFDPGPVSFCVSSSADRLSVFIINDQSDRLQFLLNGFFRMAEFNVSHLDRQITSIDSSGDVIPLAFDVSADFHKLGIVYSISGSALRFGLFETPFGSIPSDRLARISKRVAYVSSALRYIELTLQKALEFTDDALNDLDTKLTKYAQTKGPLLETIGDDFLQMLTFGNASPELEHFVSHSLTDKGMRKLFNSIDNSYQNAFHLLSMNFDSSISALYHHLTALKNLVPLDDDDALWDESIQFVASLSLKVTRTLDIIESDSKAVTIFVRWLHRCVLAVSDENLSPSLSHYSYDDVDSLAEFIQSNFCKSIAEDSNGDFGTSAQSGQFGLNKVGQLLKNCTIRTESSADEKLVIAAKPFHDKSLVDCVKIVSESVGKILERISAVFSQRFVSVSSTCCGCGYAEVPKDVILTYDIDRSCFRTVFAARIDSGDIFVTEFNENTASIIASWKVASEVGMSRNVIDLNLYSPAVVTTLVRERKDCDNDWNYVVYQLDETNLRSLPSAEKAIDFRESRCRHEWIIVAWDSIRSQTLSDGQFCSIAASGARKVGCAVFACRTRLKLLEMDPEDDTMTQSHMSEDENGTADNDAV